jgi:hypothetical protein
MYFAADAMDDLFNEDLDEAVYRVARGPGGRLRVDRSQDIQGDPTALAAATRPGTPGVWVDPRSDVATVAGSSGFSHITAPESHRGGRMHVHGLRSGVRGSHIFYGAVPEGDFADFDAFEDAMVDALDEEDTDEFFRRLVRGIGRVARVVAPIASAIPLPWTQAIGRVARVAGRLMADGADEFEAIDALVDLAEAEDLWDAAAPAIATMAVHGAMPQAARLPTSTRQQLVRATTQTAQALANRQGTQAVRTLPAVVQTAQRVVQQQGLPPRALPQTIQRIGMRLSRNPQMVRRLLRSASPALRSSICTACAHSLARRVR